MANNLIGCWGLPTANQIIRHSNPIFSTIVKGRSEFSDLLELIEVPLGC